VRPSGSCADPMIRVKARSPVVGRKIRAAPPAALGKDEPGARKIQTPGLRSATHLLRQTLADLLQSLARVNGGRDIDHGAVSGADETLNLNTQRVSSQTLSAAAISTPAACRQLPPGASWRR